MAKHCSISINLESPATHEDRSGGTNSSRVYREGDVIRGEVVVTVREPIECKQLVISHGWMTHGKGSSDGQIIETIKAHSGKWDVGVYRFPFEFIACSTPYSYRGKLVNIDWYIKAHAQINKLLGNVDYKLDYILLPPASSELAITLVEPAYFNKDKPLAIYLIVGTLGLWSFWSFVTGFDDINGILSIIWMGIKGLFTLYMIKIALRAYQENKLSVIKQTAKLIQINPPTLEISLTFNPNRKVTLKQIDTTLFFKEKATSGGGSSETTKRNDIEITSVTQPMQQQLKAAQTFTTQPIVIELPNQITPTFESEHNSILWQLDIEVTTSDCTVTCEPNIHVMVTDAQQLKNLRLPQDVTSQEPLGNKSLPLLKSDPKPVIYPYLKQPQANLKTNTNSTANDNSQRNLARNTAANTQLNDPKKMMVTLSIIAGSRFGHYLSLLGYWAHWELYTSRFMMSKSVTTDLWQPNMLSVTCKRPISLVEPLSNITISPSQRPKQGRLTVTRAKTLAA